MKKHKRDVHRRAYLKGYQAGISGRSRDDCPVAERADWQAGWRDGRRLLGRQDRRLGHPIESDDVLLNLA